MTRAPARFDTCALPTGPELMIGRGANNATQLLLIQPFFEEGTFTRSFAADLIDGLVAAGIGGWLFDLPGQGDSLASLDAVRLADWRAAAARAAGRVTERTGRMPHLATIRGGALLADAVPARSCWRLAACDGAALLRPLQRAGALGDSAGLAGWPVGEEMIADLRAAAPLDPAAPRRDVAWPAGAPPWRRAEPSSDAAAAASLAADLADWIAACDDR